MAILSEHPGIKAAVLVDRKPVKEYKADDVAPTPNSITSYIEAQSGATFQIKLKFRYPFPANNCISLHFSVDGICTGEHPLFPDEILMYNSHISKGYIYRDGSQDLCKRYYFSALKSLADDNGKFITKEAKADFVQVGTISVKIYNIKIVNLHDYTHLGLNSADLDPGLGAVPEKLMKGDVRSHEVRFLAPRKIDTKWYDFVRLSDTPIVEFHFKYRSLESLKSLGIIPRTPSPVPLEDRPEAELNPAEMLELVRLLKKRDTYTTGQVKQEIGNKMENEIKQEYKRERPEEDPRVEVDDEIEVVKARPVKRRRIDSAAVIDLT